MKSKSTGCCKRCTFQIGLIQKKYFPFPISSSRCWQKYFRTKIPLFPAPEVDFDSAKRSCLWPFEVSERPPVGCSSNKLSAQLWSFVYLFVLCFTLKQLAVFLMAEFQQSISEISLIYSHFKDTMNCPEKVMKISHFNQTNQRILSILR